MNSENIGGQPKRATVPSVRLRDTENTATLELPSHRSTKSGTQGVSRLGNNLEWRRDRGMNSLVGILTRVDN